MVKIGLTGNIGSGKTFVCQLFEALGVPVFYADLEARAILNHPRTLPLLTKEFGNEIINDILSIDRKKLAGIVFNNPEKLQVLNGIIHPQLFRDFKIWALEQTPKPYVIMEAAILFESGFQQFVDKTVFISAPADLRIQRVIQRDGMTRQEVEERMKNQLSDAQKESLSDFVISNDGQTMLLPQIINLHHLFNSL